MDDSTRGDHDGLPSPIPTKPSPLFDSESVQPTAPDHLDHAFSEARRTALNGSGGDRDERPVRSVEGTSPNRPYGGDRQPPHPFTDFGSGDASWHLASQHGYATEADETAFVQLRYRTKDEDGNPKKVPVPVRPTPPGIGAPSWVLGTSAQWYYAASFGGVDCWRTTDWRDPANPPTPEQVAADKKLTAPPERVAWIAAAPPPRLYCEDEAEPVPPGSLLVIPEGESDVDTLLLEGIPAITNPGGALALTPEIEARFVQAAQGRWVVLAMDQDKTGVARVERLGQILAPVAARLTLWTPTRDFTRGETPKGYDVRDWMHEHPEETVDLPDHLEEAPDWSPGLAEVLLESPEAKAAPDVPVPWAKRETATSAASQPRVLTATSMADALSQFKSELSGGQADPILDFNLLWGSALTYPDDDGETQRYPPVPLQVFPGEGVMIFGDTKLGKSSLMANIAFLAMQGLRGHPVQTVLDASLEMPLQTITTRYLQIAHGLKEGADAYGIRFNDVREAVANHDPATLLEPLFRLHTFSIRDARLPLERLEAEIVRTGARLVVVDTLDQIEHPLKPNGGAYSDLEGFTRALESLMAMAERLGVALLIVHHINKTGQRAVADGSIPTLGDAKGLTSVSQKVSFCVGYGGPRSSRYRGIAIRAARRTEGFGRDELWFEGDPLTNRFKPLREKPIF